MSNGIAAFIYAGISVLYIVGCDSPLGALCASLFACNAGVHIMKALRPREERP